MTARRSMPVSRYWARPPTVVSGPEELDKLHVAPVHVRRVHVGRREPAVDERLERSHPP